MKEHLKRAHYVTFKALNILSPEVVLPKPTDSGWYVDDEYLLPTEGLKLLPEDLISVCGCKGKCTGRRKCFKYGQPCVIYCHKNHLESACTNVS